MVDTTAMLEAEEWMREWGLPKQFDGMKFCKLKLKLKWVGEFEFDAVSEDRTIACCISTSRTMNPGQERKILADAFYLLHAVEPKSRYLVFTEKDIYEAFEDKVKEGRFPKDSIKLLHVELDTKMAEKVNSARTQAVSEATRRSV